MTGTSGGSPDGASGDGTSTASAPTPEPRHHTPQIKAVGLSCFAMALVGLDAAGEAVTPVYTNADWRNADAAKALRAELERDGALDAVQGRTAPLDGRYAPALLLRLRESADAEERAAGAKVVRWTTLSALLLERITGAQQPVTISEAACTGLLDRVELQWHAGLLDRLAVPPGKLPPLCGGGDMHRGGLLPPLQERWPELAGAAWARGVGDYAAANVGTGCERRGRVCVTMGANASMRMFVERAAPPAGGGGGGSDAAAAVLPEMPPQLWCYSISEELALVGGDLADGGSIYAWGMEQLAAGGLEEMARLQQECSALPADSHGLTVLPFFSGESAGLGMPAGMGTITGMTLNTSRADLLRAMMESVALRLKGTFEQLRALAPGEACEVLASGKALFKSPLWQQMLANALGVPVTVQQSAAHACSTGAGLLALRGIGVPARAAERGAGSDKKSKTERVVAPNPDGVAAMALAFERQEALRRMLVKS